jgi:hypothetical protein
LTSKGEAIFARFLGAVLVAGGIWLIAYQRLPWSVAGFALLVIGFQEWVHGLVDDPRRKP